MNLHPRLLRNLGVGMIGAYLNGIMAKVAGAPFDLRWIAIGAMLGMALDACMQWRDHRSSN